MELVNGGTKLQSTGKIYYSWDLRAASFFLGLVFLLIYYKRYHMMRNLINEGGCLSSLRRLPGAVCSCLCCGGRGGCREEAPVRAAPDLDIMRNFLREPNLRYLQVRFLPICSTLVGFFNLVGLKFESKSNDFESS